MKSNTLDKYIQINNFNDFKGIFSGSTLKIIAIIAMIIDHVGAFILSNTAYTQLSYNMRLIGRISFPIYCFLLVEGYFYTKNVWKYLIRLFIFALISELPFDMAHTGKFTIEFTHQNVLFTLSLCLLLLIIIDRYVEDIMFRYAIIIMACAVAFFTKIDYIFYGVIEVVIFYYLRNFKIIKIIAVSGLNILMGQWTGSIALVLTELYNNKRGLKLKYLFYIVYPLHLLIIYFIRVYAL